MVLASKMEDVEARLKEEAFEEDPEYDEDIDNVSEEDYDINDVMEEEVIEREKGPELR